MSKEQSLSVYVPTAAQKEARRIVEAFYMCMPLNDVKLTDCGENRKLIVEMEMLSAQQCAILHVKGILNYVPDGQESAYLQSILSEIEKM